MPNKKQDIEAMRKELNEKQRKWWKSLSNEEKEQETENIMQDFFQKQWNRYQY